MQHSFDAHHRHHRRRTLLAGRPRNRRPPRPRRQHDVKEAPTTGPTSEDRSAPSSARGTGPTSTVVLTQSSTAKRVAAELGVFPCLVSLTSPPPTNSSRPRSRTPPPASASRSSATPRWPPPRRARPADPQPGRRAQRPGRHPPDPRLRPGQVDGDRDHGAAARPPARHPHRGHGRLASHPTDRSRKGFQNLFPRTVPGPTRTARPALCPALDPTAARPQNVGVRRQSPMSPYADIPMELHRAQPPPESLARRGARPGSSGGGVGGARPRAGCDSRRCLRGRREGTGCPRLQERAPGQAHRLGGRTVGALRSTPWRVTRPVGAVLRGLLSFSGGRRRAGRWP